MSAKPYAEVSAVEAHSLLGSPERPLLIDVREQSEWDAGYLQGATHAPKGTIGFTIASIAPEKSTPILLYCAGGVRSAGAPAAPRPPPPRAGAGTPFAWPTAATCSA